MADKKSSILKIFLLIIGFFTFLLILLLVFFGFIASKLIDLGLKGSSIEVEQCDIQNSLPLQLKSPHCSLFFPLAGGKAHLAMDEVEITFEKETVYPSLKVASLSIETPDLLKAKSNSSSAASDFFLPFKNIQIEKGEFKSGDNLKGKFNLNADLKIQNFLLTKDSLVNLKVKELAGRFPTFEFSSASGELTLSGFPQWKLQQPVDIKIKNINTGVIFRDTGFKLNMNKGKGETSNFLLENLETKFLQGKIYSKKIVIENYKPQPFILDLDKIDLSSLLSLAGQSVKGKGIISGQLPVNFVDNQLSIDQGSLSALSPGGELHYVSNAPLPVTEKDEANVAIKALENFYYDKMDIKLQYGKDGVLDANISLSGKNPELFNGKLINFNINLQENVLTLLRSLRLVTQVNKEDWQQGK